jgi:hypothetical protein
VAIQLVLAHVVCAPRGEQINASIVGTACERLFGVDAASATRLANA